MFEYLFFDLDDTLLDFHKAESIAVAKAFRQVGVEPREELIRRYSVINSQYWQMLEEGKLTRQQVLVQRFAALFQELGLDADAHKCQEYYEEYLCVGHYFIDGAQEILDYLKPKYRMFLASNGTARVQDARLKSSGIGEYMEDLFISERMGADKPTPEFFRRCFARIPGFDPDKALMIGDRLTSDIIGGSNAGIHTCWFNPGRLTAGKDIKIDYEIHSLLELKNFL